MATQLSTTALRKALFATYLSTAPPPVAGPTLVSSTISSSTPAPAPPLDEAASAPSLLSSLPAESTDAPSTFFLETSNSVLINTGTLDLSSLSGSWGPHPIMRLQSLFLQLHESFPLSILANTPSGGLAWYALIPIVTIVLRLLLFNFQVRAQANAARMAIIQPKMLEGMAKVKAAKENRDAAGASMAQLEVQTLMKNNNVNPIRNLAFPLAQATVFMTMFFAIRGLAGAELPSMMVEGPAWVANLTAPDPTWVLPVASTVLTLATLEFGVDSTTQVQTSTTKNMKLFFRVMLCVALPFIAYFPAAVLVYWVTNNSISLLQSLLLKTPSVRRFFGIPVIPPKKQPGEEGYIAEPSFIEAFRNVQSGIGEKFEESLVKGEKEARRRKAFEEGTMMDDEPVRKRSAVGGDGVYAPRAPVKRKFGRLVEVSKEIAGLRDEAMRKQGNVVPVGVQMDSVVAEGTQEITAVQRNVGNESVAEREVSLEAEKMRRVLEARKRRRGRN